MFDPEKVERMTGNENLSGISWAVPSVSASDYDALLALYRDQSSLLQRLDSQCSIGCLSLPTVRHWTQVKG